MQALVAVWVWVGGGAAGCAGVPGRAGAATCAAFAVGNAAQQSCWPDVAAAASFTKVSSCIYEETPHNEQHHKPGAVSRVTEGGAEGKESAAKATGAAAGAVGAAAEGAAGGG